MALPSRDLPFMSRTAALASAGLSKVTNAKPRDLLVSRSFIRSTSMTRPYLPNSASRVFSSMSGLSPPMKSFPGRSASTMTAERGAGGGGRRRGGSPRGLRAGRPRAAPTGRLACRGKSRTQPAPPLRRPNVRLDCAAGAGSAARRAPAALIGWLVIRGPAQVPPSGKLGSLAIFFPPSLRSPVSTWPRFKVLRPSRELPL